VIKTLSRILFLIFLSQSALLSAEKINVAELQKAYEKNNRKEMPVISWMDDGAAKFLLFSDRILMKEDERSKSRLSFTQLTEFEYQELIQSVLALKAFFDLKKSYELTDLSEGTNRTIRLRISGRDPVSVNVYGRFEDRSTRQRPVPPAFVEMTKLLTVWKADNFKPWDPGYVEIEWADFEYAKEKPKIWPKEWPDLKSPLARSLEGFVIEKIVLFPSSRAAELDDFFEKEANRPVLINGRKMSGGYYWPLRWDRHRNFYRD
jgi:hypothetical protein